MDGRVESTARRDATRTEEASKSIANLTRRLLEREKRNTRVRSKMAGDPVHFKYPMGNTDNKINTTVYNTPPIRR